MDAIPRYYVRAYSVISTKGIRRVYHDAPDSLGSGQTLFISNALPDY